MSYALTKAVEILGSQTKLAAAINVRPQAVQQWVRAGRLPEARVIQVARAVNFEVTPHELAPEMYPAPDDGVPEELRGRAAA